MRIFDLLGSRDLDLDPMTFIYEPDPQTVHGDMPHAQIWTYYVKAFESYRLTDMWSSNTVLQIEDGGWDHVEFEINAKTLALMGTCWQNLVGDYKGRHAKVTYMIRLQTRSRIPAWRPFAFRNRSSNNSAVDCDISSKFGLRLDFDLFKWVSTLRSRN